MSKTKGAKARTFRAIYDYFDAPVVDIDCGQKCKHLNGGSPVCCDTANAIPIVQKGEWKALKKRSDLWRPFKPSCTHSQEIVDSLHSSCKAIECKGAQFCERDNRSLACRTFPFFPYITNKDDLIGLAYYWTFEDRCWVISNLARVTPGFVQQFITAQEQLFEADPDERDVYRQYSATMRRVFSRWKRPIPLINRDGGYSMIQPNGGGIRKIKAAALPSFAPYAD